MYFLKVLFGVISIVAFNLENERTATICFVCLNYDVVCLCHAQKNRQFIDGKLEQNEANLQKNCLKIFIKSISTKIQSTVNKYYFC